MGRFVNFNITNIIVKNIILSFKIRCAKVSDNATPLEATKQLRLLLEFISYIYQLKLRRLWL